MTTLTEEISRLIDKCSDEEKRIVLKYLRNKAALHPLEIAWNTTAESLLSAIARSGDLTQRGIRGILAEATFEEIVVRTSRCKGGRARRVLDTTPTTVYSRKTASRCGFRSNSKERKRVNRRNMLGDQGSRCRTHQMNSTALRFRRRV